MFVYVYRLRDVEAKNFFCGYCMKCKCMKYGCNACLIGTYILCCDCGLKKQMILNTIMDDNINDNKKPLKMKNMKGKNSIKYDAYDMNNDLDNQNVMHITSDKYKLTFIAYLKAKWNGRQMITDDMIDGSEMSAYSSTSEFLYRQQSGYGGHIGVHQSNSRSPMGATKQSICDTDEDYIL